MCGEIDENVLINQELLDRFLLLSEMRGVHPLETPGDGPGELASAEGRAQYMEKIFGLGLTRAVTDAARANEDEAVDAIASQAIAFARLAGFLASQLPPDADLFRSVIEAVSEGHSETQVLEARFRKMHAPAHDHSHGDDHHHH